MSNTKPAGAPFNTHSLSFDVMALYLCENLLVAQLLECFKDV